MESSKDIATIVALEHLGVHAADFTGVLFLEAVAGGPAEGLLEATDVILSINGAPVTTVESLRAVLADLEPGMTPWSRWRTSRPRERRDVEIMLGTTPDGGGPFIGVSGVTERVDRSPLPFDVDISSGSVGGPSAGLAFTLVVIDVLTPGELTGGKRVAVTGNHPPRRLRRRCGGRRPEGGGGPRCGRRDDHRARGVRGRGPVGCRRCPGGWGG